ncbi:LamG domain-containing protein [Candidatus Poribacteria bacterium]|nr:LamG domain-containing protein [Candidatus Poribacteria bacterium]
MIHRHILTCFFLLTLIPLSAKAFPPASPAGGNYLTLDGMDDYAVLDFKTFGVLLPKGTEEFTVEAWVYPTTPPAGNIYAMILSQQVEMQVGNDNGERDHLKQHINWQTGDLFLFIKTHIMVGGIHPATKGRVVALSPNRWHHIAYQSDGRAQANIVNDFAMVREWPIGWPIAHDLSHFEHPKDFTLGGFGEKIKLPHGDHFRGPFAGYIDEVRISTVARYDVSKDGFTPSHKFKKDRHTLALWHFDEPGGRRNFSDASGNKHHLVGEGGARTSIPLAVEPHGKLTTTWGRLKQ